MVVGVFHHPALFFVLLAVRSVLITFISAASKGQQMTNAEIISIGTELLLGEITDTNSRKIALALRDIGVDIFRMVTIGDNLERIAAAVQDSLGRAEIVITTGGLGPTVDDPTREAAALALGTELVFLPDLWDQIQARFATFGKIPGDNNRKQAFIPRGAIPVENPNGTAPAFFFEIDRKTLISLPGVPPEMVHLLENRVIPYLLDRYRLDQSITIKTIHTRGVGESRIDSLIQDLEHLRNPTVGLLSKKGGVDIRIAAKSRFPEQAEEMIREIVEDLQKRLGEWIIED
jgi:competence/damage-inducible protein CinA-like protein